MAGPFEGYSPPGNYSRTNVEEPQPIVAASARVPVFIGTGSETLQRKSFEVIRGSSATVDTAVYSENVSSRFLTNNDVDNPVYGEADGTIVKFRVQKYPIVTGSGSGVPSSNPAHVSVVVNDEAVVVTEVDGANGYITLSVGPDVNTTTKVTYFYRRSDTQITETISSQVTLGLAVLESSAETFDVVADVNDSLILIVDGVSSTIPLTAGLGRTAAQIKTDIDAVGPTGLTVSTDVRPSGSTVLRLTADQEVATGAGTANAVFGWNATSTSGRNRIFKVAHFPIVDGRDGAITTTDPSHVTVTVDGDEVEVSEVDGTNGLVTVSLPPKAGAVVTVTHYFSNWQDTGDTLPDTGIVSIDRVGNTEGSSDYTQEVSFVLDSENSKILWGAAYRVVSNTHTSGSEYLDTTQISPTLIDNKVYLAECIRSGTSRKEFVLPIAPTTGNGYDTPLGSSVFQDITNSRRDLPNDRPDLVSVYHGVDIRDALGRPAVSVSKVDSSSRKVTLTSPIPPDHKAYATFWYNRLADAYDTSAYNLTVVTAGGSGAGTYTVTGQNNSVLRQVKFSKPGLVGSSPAVSVAWPSGSENQPDAIHYGGTSIDEIVTVVFRNYLKEPAQYVVGNSDSYDLRVGFSDQLRPVPSNTAVAPIELASSRVKAHLAGGYVNGVYKDSWLGKKVALDIDGTVYETVAIEDGDSIADIVTKINNELGGCATFRVDANQSGFGHLVLRGSAAPGVLEDDEGDDTTIGDPSVTSKYVEVIGTADAGDQLDVADLGLVMGTKVYGVPRATTMPAWQRGSVAGPYEIDADTEFSFSVDGVDILVTLPNGGAVSTVACAAAINAVTSVDATLVATYGAGQVPDVAYISDWQGGGDRLMLFSPSEGDASNITIGSSAVANELLGFTAATVAHHTPVSAIDLATVLNAHDGGNFTTPVANTFRSNFVADTITDPTEGASGTFLRIRTRNSGTSASITFASAEDDAQVLNVWEVLGVAAGDSDSGQGSQQGFYVYSNQANGTGSADDSVLSDDGTGSDGFVGVTYTDSITGLRFTVLPSEADYDEDSSFRLTVTRIHTANANAPTYSIPGLSMLVANTLGVAVGDSAKVETFDRSSGEPEPEIGNSYYVDWSYTKTDITPKIFTDMNDVVREYGPVSPSNRLSLAAWLAIRNGASAVACKQVLKPAGMADASASTYIAALNDLKVALPNGTNPAVVVPLTGNADVHQSVREHCQMMSSVRNRKERTGIVGFPSGTTPTAAQLRARAIGNELVQVVYPDTASMDLVDELGRTTTVLVDGPIVASAYAGRFVSLSYDEATDFTSKPIIGFKKMMRTMDEVTMNQVASAGITLIHSVGSRIEVRHSVTTDMSSVLTRTPSVIQVKHRVQRGVRTALNKYIGNKNVGSLIGDAEKTVKDYLGQEVGAQIIAAYDKVKIKPNDNDPTIWEVSAAYQTILPVLWIVTTFTLRVKL